MRDSGHGFIVALPMPGFVKPAELSRVNFLNAMVAVKARRFQTPVSFIPAF